MLGTSSSPSGGGGTRTPFRGRKGQAARLSVGTPPSGPDPSLMGPGLDLLADTVNPLCTDCSPKASSLAWALNTCQADRSSMPADGDAMRKRHRRPPRWGDERGHSRNGSPDLAVVSFSCDPGFRTGIHHHTAHSVALITSGRASFRWGDATQEEAELGPGYWLYVGAAVPHEELTPDHSRADVIVVLNRRGGRTVFP